MNKLMIFVLALSLPVDLIAQNGITLYYDASWKITTRENGVVRREATMDFSMMTFNGKFSDFSRDNKLLAEGEFVKGVKAGNHKSYLEDGTLQSSINWNMDDFTILEWKGEDAAYSVSNGNGKFKIEYALSRGKIHGILEGEFRNKERVGKWKYLDSLGNPVYEETYRHGDFKSAIEYLKVDPVIKAVKRSIVAQGGVAYPDDKWRTVNKLKIVLSRFDHGEKFDTDKLAYKNLFAFISQCKGYCDTVTNSTIRFPGAGGYQAVIGEELHYPPLARRSNIQGTVIVRLVIGVDGVVKSYKIIKADVTTLIFEDEALRVVQLLEDKWLPAHRNCIPYESMIAVPISFKIGN